MPAANATKYVDGRNHCPMGCAEGHLDGHGYCCHLKGFTNRGQKMECVSYNTRGMPCVGLTREIVLKSDKLVNPLKQITDESGVHMVPEWVSSRVYRKCSDEEAKAWRNLRVAPVDEDTLTLADAV